MSFDTIRWEQDRLWLLDQRKLPGTIEYLEMRTAAQVSEAIRTMVVRGAPAIGVTAGYGMVLAAREACGTDDFMGRLVQLGEQLKRARPTAVNLSWAVERMLACAASTDREVLLSKLEQEAREIHREDIQNNRRLGEYLLELTGDHATVLTHCNAGKLAATEYGTALAPMYVAKERGGAIKVYADETRPRCQGASLTAFELMQEGIDVTVQVDGAAAVLLASGEVDAVIVGADRVAANGDTANKIGTLMLAIAAKHYGIPFYVACPTPTIDFSLTQGGQIPIEQRGEEEVTAFGEKRTAPEGVKVFSPAFDVTPAELITAIVTEKGICRAPYLESFQKMVIGQEERNAAGSFI